MEQIAQSDIDSAEVVVLLNVLGYVAHPAATLALLWQRLSPGTRLIVRQYDYGCTIYSGIPFDLQLRLLSGLANKLAVDSLEPHCDAFLGRELSTIVHDAQIADAELTTDTVQVAAPLSPGAEYYLREKGVWIGLLARDVSRDDSAAWRRCFDPSDAEYVLSRSDAVFTTVEFQAEAVK